MVKKYLTRRNLFANFHLLISFIFAVTGCNPKPLSFDPSQIKSLSIRTYFPEALAIAKEWDSSAYPTTQIVVNFTMPENENDLLISYSFRAKDEPQKWLHVIIIESDPIKIEYDEGEFKNENKIRSSPEIDIDNLPIDSLDAIEIAYKNGGDYVLQKYRALNPQLSMAILEVYKKNDETTQGHIPSETEKLVWRVTFSPVDRRSSMYISIDAITGEYIEKLSSDDL